MLIPTRTLIRLEVHFLRATAIRTTQPPWRSFIRRSFAITPQTQYSPYTTDTVSTTLATESLTSIHDLDAFKDSSILDEARKRWGLEPPAKLSDSRTESTTEVASPSTRSGVIYPQGRPEIAELTRKMMEARISNGHTGRRRHETQEPTSSTTHSTSSETLKGSTASSPNPQFHRASMEDAPLWKKHRETIKAKIGGEAWNPRRKITRQSMEEVRYLRRQFPTEWTTAKLAEHFNMPNESIVRILKSNYQPSPERAAQQDEVRLRKKKERVDADIARILKERQEKWEASRLERGSTNRRRDTGRAHTEFSRQKSFIPRQRSYQQQQQPQPQTQQPQPQQQQRQPTKDPLSMTPEELEQFKNDRHAAWMAERKLKSQKTAVNVGHINLGAPTRRIDE
ncbi:Required for respiratory growth protein 9 mitochondrial [Linnemannia zychae]|nr:Required for respiratory growth protein 9 mitochondrial [Linnemannia zychae]